jgi:hypothetical protein
MLPVRPFLRKFKIERRFSDPNHEGIEPVKALSNKTMEFRVVKAENEDGMVPVKLLPDKERVVRAANPPSTVGMVPVNALRVNTKTPAASSFPKSREWPRSSCSLATSRFS